MTFKEVLLKHGFTQLEHRLSTGLNITTNCFTKEGIEAWYDMDYLGKTQLKVKEINGGISIYFAPESLDRDLTKHFTKHPAFQYSYCSILQKYGFEFSRMTSNVMHYTYSDIWKKEADTIEIRHNALSNVYRIFSEGLLIPEDHLESYLANKYPKSPTFESVLLKHGYIKEGAITYIRDGKYRIHKAIIMGNVIEVLALSKKYPDMTVYKTSPIIPTPEQLDTILSVIAID